MAKPTQKAVELGELIRRSEAARLSIGRAHQLLKHRLDAPSRIKESLKAQPAKWIGGSIVAGFVGSFLFKSRKKKMRDEVKATGKGRNSLLRLLGLNLLVKILKPAAKIYATKLLKDYVAQHVARGGFERNLGVDRPPY
jgi:hypothetical protein